MRKSKIARFSVLCLALLAMFFSLIIQGGCENKAKSQFAGFPQSFADLAEKVRPAVVNISTPSTVTIPGNLFRHFLQPDQGGQNGPFDDFFKNFFDQTPDRKMKQQSLGSGFIINKDGYIITNNHVVEHADEIKVKLSDGREFKAKVVGRDKKTDLALIKISSLFKDLPVLELGNSDKMRVGDWVLAVGTGQEYRRTQRSHEQKRQRPAGTVAVEERQSDLLRDHGKQITRRCD